MLGWVIVTGVLMGCGQTAVCDGPECYCIEGECPPDETSPESRRSEVPVYPGPCTVTYRSAVSSDVERLEVRSYDATGNLLAMTVDDYVDDGLDVERDLVYREGLFVEMATSRAGELLWVMYYEYEDGDIRSSQLDKAPTDGVFESEYIYLYDADGRIASITRYRGNEMIALETREYIDGPADEWTEQRFFRAPFDVPRRERFREFDTDGRIVSLVDTRGPDDQYWVDTFQYTDGVNRSTTLRDRGGDGTIDQVASWGYECFED